MTIGTSSRSWLYRRPQLYDAAYPRVDRRNADMCLRVFRRFADRLPKTILDLGCGIGRDVWFLSEYCGDCVGVEQRKRMAQYASRKPDGVRPIGSVTIRTGDMRGVRVRRTFDAVLCLGSALMYCVRDTDIANAFETFAAHCHRGSLLVLDLRNSASLLGRPARRMAQTLRVGSDTAIATVTTEFDRRAQRMIRRRIWSVGRSKRRVEDLLVYRMLFPAEIKLLLEAARFELLGMFDNRQLEGGPLDADNLYVVARYRGRR